MEILSGCRFVGDGAFSGCTSLEQVALPALLIELGSGAFRGCRRLRRLEILACKRIGDGAFQDCVSLEEVVLGEGLEELGRDAFCGCRNLRVLVLPRSLKMRGNRLHEHCPQVTIRARPGSPAARYAKIHELNCEPLTPEA